MGPARALCAPHAASHAAWTDPSPAAWRAIVDGLGITLCSVGDTGARAVEAAAARRARARDLQAVQLAGITASCTAGKGCA